MHVQGAVDSANNLGGPVISKWFPSGSISPNVIMLKVVQFFRTNREWILHCYCCDDFCMPLSNRHYNLFSHNMVNM